MNESQVIENFKKFSKDKKIIKQEGNFSLLLYGGIFSGSNSKHFSNFYDFNFGKTLFFTTDSEGVSFFDAGKYKECSKDGYNRFQNKDSIEQFKEYKKFNELSSQAEDIYSNFGLGKVQEKSKKDIKDELSKLFNLLQHILAVTIFSQSIDRPLIKNLHQDISDQNTSVENLLEKLFLENFYSIPHRERRKLIEFAQGGAVIDSQWILCDYYLAPKKEEAEQALKSKLEDTNLEKLKQEQKDFQKRVTENKQKLKDFKNQLSQKGVKLFNFIDYAIKARDVRKESVQKLMTMISYLTRSYLHRLKISENFTPFVFCYDFLKKDKTFENYEEELKERSKGVLVNFYVDKSEKEPKFNLQTTSKTSKIKERLLNFLDDRENKIEGQTAFVGEVKGKVKVINSKDEFDKFESGEVLVTSMTRPEFIPLIKKSSAIVTDEGGVTSHAAIVSRELEIPCIIGTQNATDALEDGDTVGVNADEGVVKIID